MKPDIREIPLEPANPGVIDCLEKALAEARAGKLSMIAITAIARDGFPWLARSEIHNRSLMIGAMRRHEHRMLVEAEDE